MIDDLLPPLLKGKRATNDNLEAFFYKFHLSLAPPDLLAGVKDATKDVPLKMSIPPLDEAHYFLVEDRKFQHKRLRSLVAAFAMRWNHPPPVGLIWNLISAPDDYKNLEPILRQSDAPQQQTDMMDFVNIMMPPQYQKGGEVITSETAKQMTRTLLQWILKNPPTDGKKIDPNMAKGDMMTLGLRHISGSLDERRAKLAAKFIWSKEAGEPSFDKLHDWLKQQDRQAQKNADAKINAMKKKKKMQRKQKKLGRK